MSDPISAWWTAFKAQAPRIDALFKRREEWDLPAWMHEHLGAIDPNLMWEFGPAVRGPGHRLVITPESRRDLRPLARRVLAAAPGVPGWEFYEYRLAEAFEQALLTVQGRTGGDLRDVRIQAGAGRFNRVDLVFISPRFSPGDQNAFHTAFVATESLLGEEVLDRWIGAIEVSSVPETDGPEPVPVRELQAVVDSVIAGIHDSLPERPWCIADLEENWSSFQLEPTPAGDYPEQSDLFVGITLLPEMWINALSGVPFDSQRYSRCGEQFCYLKIDGRDGLERSSFKDRSEVEDALNERLRPSGLGSVVGGGTGLQYSYIELALNSVDEAWQALRSTLQDGGLPRRTWLLFHDEEQRREWRGLYDETPAAPMTPAD